MSMGYESHLTLVVADSLLDNLHGMVWLTVVNDDTFNL